jgi:hypothetical protein
MASAIARRIAADGRVTVSERKSIGGMEALMMVEETDVCRGWTILKAS